MTKLLFVHDHVFLKNKSAFYTTGSLTAEVIKRYIDVFGNITLVTRGNDVSVFKENLKPSSMDNAVFVRVPDYKTIAKLFNIFKAIKIIRNEVKMSDYIIARTSSLAYIAIKYAIKYKKPYLIEVVGCPWDALWNHSFKGKLIAFASYFIQKKAVKQASYVIYVSNHFLQKRYPTKGKCINCSNVALITTRDDVLKERIKKIKALTKGSKIVLGTIAAIDVRYKGQQYVIEALGKLKKEGTTNFEYQLVGKGKQTFLKSLASKHDVNDQVKFIGYMDHKDVWKWLDTIDIYVQPSRTEGLPRALIEAMSRALPAFGARSGGIPELINNKYLFSNSKININEICSILKSLPNDNMIFQAKCNFEESKKYKKEILDKRRKGFLKAFAEQL
jgi:glycosyltransferase involved in cell wall biosynthesis